MIEFRTARRWAIVMIIVTPLMIIGAVLCLFHGLRSEQPALRWFIVPPSIMILIMSTFALVYTIRGRIRIDGDSITQETGFWRKRLLFNDIKGYRVSEYGRIQLFTYDGRRTLTISTQTRSFDYLNRWVAEHFVNLDVAAWQQAQEDFQSNIRYGYGQEDRAFRQLQAAKTAQILNWAGGIVAAWAGLYPQPYDYAVLSCALLPLACLIACIYFRSQVLLAVPNGVASPSVSVGLTFPVLAIGLRAVVDFKVLSYEPLWLPIIAIMIAAAVVLWAGGIWQRIRFIKDRIRIAIAGMMLAAAYGFGVTIMMNCVLDTSPAQAFSAQVLDKYVTAQPNSTSNLTLAPWGPRTDTQAVSVSSSLYRQVMLHDTVTIVVRQGRLHIPWFSLSKP